MFNGKTKLADAPLGTATIIAAGTIITGDVSSDGDIRIDGLLKGNLHCKAKVLIGAEGAIDGDITGQQADILGRVNGQLRIAELLQLRGKSNIKGEIFAGKLEVEPTATFNGSCHMGANVVELNAELAPAIAK
jgi:cytoskeletal protein CcmA (bactofilin family)